MNTIRTTPLILGFLLAVAAVIAVVAVAHAQVGYQLPNPYTYSTSSANVSQGGCVEGPRNQTTGLCPGEMAGPYVPVLPSIGSTTHPGQPLVYPGNSGSGSAMLPSMSGAQCATLGVGASGASVLLLQQFLSTHALLSSASLTGYFGPLTMHAVQTWQSSNGLVSYGTPETTGFGRVGPRTAAAMRYCMALTQFPTSSTTPPTTGTAAPATCKVWFDGCNTCTRSAPGLTLMCTQKACATSNLPRATCQQFFSVTPM